MSKKNTAANLSKEIAGLKLVEVADMANTSTRNLQNWHRDNHDFFMIILLGCKQKNKGLEEDHF